MLTYRKISEHSSNIKIVTFPDSKRELEKFIIEWMLTNDRILKFVLPKNVTIENVNQFRKWILNLAMKYRPWKFEMLQICEEENKIQYMFDWVESDCRMDKYK